MGVSTSWNRSTADGLINLCAFEHPCFLRWAWWLGSGNPRFCTQTFLHYPDTALTSVAEVSFPITPAALMLNSFFPGEFTCFGYSRAPAARLQDAPQADQRVNLQLFLEGPVLIHSLIFCSFTHYSKHPPTLTLFTLCYENCKTDSLSFVYVFIYQTGGEFWLKYKHFQVTVVQRQLCLIN